jgi:hypothetical protein
VKNGVFLANENEYIFSKRNLLGSNHLLQQKKKTKLNTKVKTLQEKRIVHEAKGDLIFADEEGVPREHPQALTLVPLGYLLGCLGIPNLDLLSILHLISSFSNPYT